MCNWQYVYITLHRIPWKIKLPISKEENQIRIHRAMPPATHQKQTMWVVHIKMALYTCIVHSIHGIVIKRYFTKRGYKLEINNNF